MGGGNQGRAGRKNSRRNGNFCHARQSRFFAGTAFLRKHRMPPASRYAFAGRGWAAMFARARRFAKRRRRLFALAENRPQPLVCIAGDNAAARLAAKSGDNVAWPKPKASAARGNKIVGGGSGIKRTPLRNINPRPHPRPWRIPLAVANPANPPPPLPPRLGIGIPSIPFPNPNHRRGRLNCIGEIFLPIGGGESKFFWEFEVFYGMIRAWDMLPPLFCRPRFLPRRARRHCFGCCAMRRTDFLLPLPLFQPPFDTARGRLGAIP